MSYVDTLKLFPSLLLICGKMKTLSASGTSWTVLQRMLKVGVLPMYISFLYRLTFLSTPPGKGLNITIIVTSCFFGKVG